MAALVTRYALFAVVATAVNLATQHALLAVSKPPLALPAAMAAGTIIGLAVKYVLDKRWIFYDDTVGLAGNSRQLALYGAAGVGTTALFWVTELLFTALFSAPLLGAAIGLLLGYVTKYQLDRRFVFRGAGRDQWQGR